MSVRSRVIGLVAASCLATGLAAVSVLPAEAATGSAPVTGPDTVEAVVGTPSFVDVLGNDSDADGDALAICRLGPLPRGVQAEVLDSEMISVFATVSTSRPGHDSTTSSPPVKTSTQQLLVFAKHPGTYTLTYYACDFSSLTAGTVTLTVTEAPKVKVFVRKLADRPGKLKVVNRSGFPVQFAWGSIRADRADGVVTVGHRPVVITVRRPSIIWIAGSRRTSDLELGSIRGIRLPRGVDALPPGAPAGPLPDLDSRPLVDRGLTPGLRSWIS